MNAPYFFTWLSSQWIFARDDRLCKMKWWDYLKSLATWTKIYLHCIHGTVPLSPYLSISLSISLSVSSSRVQYFWCLRVSAFISHKVPMSIASFLQRVCLFLLYPEANSQIYISGSKTKAYPIITGRVDYTPSSFPSDGYISMKQWSKVAKTIVCNFIKNKKNFIYGP